MKPFLRSSTTPALQLFQPSCRFLIYWTHGGTERTASYTTTVNTLQHIDKHRLCFFAVVSWKYSCFFYFFTSQVISFKVTQKLLERFLHVYLQLERLRPETSSQTMLFRHVKQVRNLTWESLYEEQYVVKYSKVSKR